MCWISTEQQAGIYLKYFVRFKASTFFRRVRFGDGERMPRCLGQTKNWMVDERRGLWGKDSVLSGSWVQSPLPPILHSQVSAKNCPPLGYRGKMGPKSVRIHLPKVIVILANFYPWIIRWWSLNSVVRFCSVSCAFCLQQLTPKT